MKRGKVFCAAKKLLRKKKSVYAVLWYGSFSTTPGEGGGGGNKTVPPNSEPRGGKGVFSSYKTWGSFNTQTKKNAEVRGKTQAQFRTREKEK